jgi:hypothetical protein
MKSPAAPSPPLGPAGKPRRAEGRTLLWAGLGILLFLAVGFFLTTTVLFRSAYSEPKQKEAEDILTSLYESEMSYYARHHCFSADPAVLDFSPPKARYYQWSVISADCTSFVARAWANLDDDPKLDIWEITNNDAFRPLHVFDDEKNIGYLIDPKSTERWRPEDGHFKPPVIDER